MLTRRSAVAGQTGWQTLGTICNELVYENWMIEDLNVATLEREREPFNGNCLTCVGGRERLNSQTLPLELLNDGLADAVLFGEDSFRLSNFAQGSQAITLQCIIDMIRAI